MMNARERLRQEIREETRKFVVRALIVMVAALGVGIIIGRFLLP